MAPVPFLSCHLNPPLPIRFTELLLVFARSLLVIQSNAAGLIQEQNLDLLELVDLVLGEGCLRNLFDQEF